MFTFLTSTSNWNPCKAWAGDACKNVPNGDDENSTSNSCPLETVCGIDSPPPQNFNITGSRVV